MTRTAQFLSRAVWQYLFAVFGMNVMITVVNALITPYGEYEFTSGRLIGLMFTFALLMPTIVQASAIPIYLPIGLSMGATRRNFFLGLQIAKLHIALGMAALFEIGQILVQHIFRTPLAFFGPSLISICMIILLSATIGELLGFAALRFGRKGMVVICITVGILSGILGGVVGFLSGSSEWDGLFDMVFDRLMDAGPFSAVLLAAVIVLTAVNGRICRRVSL